LKAINAGVDAIVCEGFEAGGHNGREETTTFCLIPLIKNHIKQPIIAAGGIACGKSMLAAMVLGADAVQIGSRFVVSKESSAHINFKNKIVQADENDTILTLKELAPVRLMKNSFYKQIFEAYQNGKNTEQLKKILGRGRAKKGMFEGDLAEGELEIGQVSAMIKEVIPAADIMSEIIEDFEKASKNVLSFKL